MNDTQHYLLDLRHEHLLRKFGIEYLTEPLIERRDDADLMRLYRAYVSGDAVEIKDALVKLCEHYWHDRAVSECQQYDEEWTK